MLALRLVSASVTAMLPELTGDGASALADMGLTPASLSDTGAEFSAPAATEVTLERKTSDTSTAAETKKENELYSWLRDKAGLSQAVIEKSKAKLSEEDVDSVEALQALHKLGHLADVFSPVPAQQIADALATDAAPEVTKNPWETGEPGYWDTSGQWVSTDAPAQGGGKPAASLQPEQGRCGPMFNGTRCDCSHASWAVFCNSENGWCGDSAEHANADDLTKFDCPLQLRPALPTEGRCGPLFKGKRCDCSGVFQWCNSGTGWCGDTAEHANADGLTKFDCPRIPEPTPQPTEGRCGALFDGARCDCSGVFLFCNSENGWCGDSAEHANADELTKFDCPRRKRPVLPTEGRCGPLFKGKRCDCSGVFQWCNSGTGWCGDSAEHANADGLTKFDCPRIPQPTPQPTEGRCGALFDGARCDCSGVFQWCNSENGWCGDTAEHAHADELTKFDCPRRARPSLPTEGRCGALFKGKRCDCSTDSSFQWCNSETGWCGDSTEHANADGLTKYDCLSARDAPGAPEAQGHGKDEKRTGDPSLDELEERLRDLEETRCQTAGKRCKAAAAVPVPVPPDSSKQSESKGPSIAGGSLVS